MSDTDEKPSEKPSKAERQVKEARERLFSTAQEIQSRLEPSRLLDDAVEGVKTRSAEIARTAGEKARERPGAVIGAAVAGIALLARRPLWRLGRRIVGRPDHAKETESDDAS